MKGKQQKEMDLQAAQKIIQAAEDKKKEACKREIEAVLKKYGYALKAVAQVVITK